MSAVTPVRRWLDTSIVFLATLAFGLALAQRTMYGVDGWVLLRRIVGGDLRSDMHLAFKPVAHFGMQVGQSLGMTAHDAVVATCAFCTALGVAFFHRAALTLGAGRSAAVVLAIGTMATPGIAFFATVVERHGVFMAGVGLSAWAAAVLATSPSLRSAALAGVAVAIAYALHSTGAVLWLAFVPFAIAAAAETSSPPIQPTRRHLWFAATALVIAGLVILGFRSIALAVGTMRDPGASFAFFLAHAKVHGAAPAMLPRATWNEILVPLLPFSLTWVLAFAKTSSRWTAAAVAVATGAYAVLVWLMLGDFDERGAYTLPLAWPFVWLTWRAVGTRSTALAIGLALGLALLGIRRHDDRHSANTASGIRSLVGTAPLFFLPAAPADFELIYLHFPDLRGNEDVWDLYDAAHFPIEAITANADFLTKTYLGGKLAGGSVVLLSEAGLTALETPSGDAAAGPVIARLLRREFELEAVSAEGFRGWRLQPRR